MMFAEDLPASCPPADAVDVELADVFRLTEQSACSLDHFKSYAALGKIPPRGLSDFCGWASCSLTTDPRALKKLSKLKHRFAVKLHIPRGAGLSKKGGVHIHFWRLAKFDPVAAVIGLEDLNG